MVTRVVEVTRRTISKFLLAGGRGNFDFVADLAVRRACRWGGGGDETLLGVDFLAAHECVFDFFRAPAVQKVSREP